jgi:hemoglobin
MSEENEQQQEGPTPYEIMGGQENVYALVDRFYDLMDEAPEYYDLRKMHPPTLDGSRDKLKWFLSGWLGGPPVYFEKVGHPMLRARHLPYAIGMEARDQWLACMYSAMEDVGVPEALKKGLQEAFLNTADWMRNKEG